MALPDHSSRDKTRDSLHQAALAMSTVAKLGRERDEKFFHHLTLTVSPDGMTTGPTQFGEFVLNFKTATVDYSGSSISLDGLNQVTLTDALVKALADAGHEVEPDRSELTHETPFLVDTKAATAYLQVLGIVNAAMGEFRVALKIGTTNPVIFPHHFDLSFLWFNAEPEDEHNQPHLNFGFSPGGDSVSHEPYLYAYAWDGTAYLNLDVSPPLKHDPNFTTGVMLPYAALRSAEDAKALIKNAPEDIKQAAEPLWI